MNITIKKIVLLLCLTRLFYGCDSDPFPVGENFSGVTEVPFVTTYTFQFKTGTETISGPEANLQIISAADVNNLSVSASTPDQEAENGVVSGLVENAIGEGIDNVAIGGRDVTGKIFLNATGDIKSGLKNASGEIVTTILYNSINGVPEFINVNGTASSGSFTALNVPPGEYYLNAVRGGRGSARLTAFAGSVSMTKMSVFPVAIPTIGLNGQVREADDVTPLGQAEITLPGLGGRMVSSSGGAYSGTGFGSDSRFLVKVTADAHYDTYQGAVSDLSLIQAGAVTQEIVRNLQVFSAQEVTSLAAQAGVTLIPNRGIILGFAKESGGKKENTQIVVTDVSGEEIGEIVYFDANHRPNCCLPTTTTDGGFLVFNLPPGEVFIKAQAIVAQSGGTGELKSSGSVRTQVFPGGVTLDEINLLPIQRVDQSSTLVLSGHVLDENGVAVGAASISLIGISDSLPNSNGTGDIGAYTIPMAANVNVMTPVLGNSSHTFRVDATGHVPTYQDVFTGSEDLVKDLEVVSTALVGPTNGFGVILGRVQNRRVGGRVDQLSLIVTQVIGSTQEAITTGEAVGTILYFDPSGIPDPTLNATSEDGRYLIKDLPIGQVMLKTHSSDDSGNQITSVFADSVTLSGITVNHVPESVTVSGTMTDLSATDVSGVMLSVLGEQGVFSSEDFVVPDIGIQLPTVGDYIIKAEKNGAITTFNRQVRTALNPLSGQALYITTPTELQSMALASGLSPDLQKGMVSGVVIESRLEAVTAPTQRPALSGTAPRAIASGFFNADNFPDIAVVDVNGPAGGQVEIFIGKEGGGFSAHALLSAGLDPRSIASADINNDGLIDLVVANFGDNTLSLFTGQGNGLFTSLSTQSIGIENGPVFVLTEDIDGDGNIDLVVANESSDLVSVLIGEGNGAFSLNGSPCAPTAGNPGSICVVNSSPISVAAGEFDGDDKLDLAVVASGSSELTFFLSRTQAVNTLLAGTQPSAIVTGDVNGDGNLDLVVSNAGSNDISAFLGDGIGSFTKVDCNLLTENIDNCLIFSDGRISRPQALILIDFDEDGRLDLAVANEGSRQLTILLGNGNGQFGVASSVFPLGEGTSALISGDFNQDEEHDFLMINTVSSDVDLLESQDHLGSGIVIEAHDSEGQAVGSIRYFNDSLALDPGLDRTGASGRFMIFDLPLAVATIRSNPENSTRALAGNAVINLSAPGTLSTLTLNVDNGLSASVIVEGNTCRALGVICSRIGNVEFSFLGTKKEETCRPNSECISSLADGSFEIRLDPHSSYTVKLVAPEIQLARDSDGDGVRDTTDNCPNITNPNQNDTNGNGIGDACELQITDNDGDGILDEDDNCPFTPNPLQRDTDCSPLATGKVDHLLFRSKNPSNSP